MSENGEDLPQSVSRWLGIVGLVVAPTTLITSLLYYFGYVSVRKRMLYLGMDPDAVGYTTSDYVTTSIGIVFAITLGVLAVSAALLLAGLYIRRLVDAGRRARLILWAAWALIGVGALATVVGLVGVWGGLFGVDLPWVPTDQKGNVTAAALGGATLILAGFWILRLLGIPDSQRRRPPGERAFLAISVAVVVAALFWATNIFASKAGEIDGSRTSTELWSRQNTIVLDTSERLHIDEMLIKETPLESTGPPEVKAFRYQCFRALAVHGDRWVLIPAKWGADSGVAMIVTANSTNHITVKRIADPDNSTGREPNVWKYWPCPELVRTVKDTEVEGLLLGVDEAREKLGDAGLVADEPYTDGPTSADTPRSFENCAAAADSLTHLPQADTGFVMLHGRTMTDTGRSPQGRWLEQNGLMFQNALQAGQFVKSVGQAWRNCAHTQLNLKYPDHTEQRTFGDVSYSPDDGVVVVSSTVEGETPRQCSHALGAKSNLVADVHICGPGQPTEASAILDAIRNKSPLWAENQR